MQIYIHRINTIKQLKEIPAAYGVEIDVRGFGEQMLLNHDPIDDAKNFDELEEYLKHFHHKGIIFNMKEAGYEQKVIDLAAKYDITEYFLLDVEFPYLYRATRKEGFRKIAVRYSEAEPIEATLAQMEGGKTLLDWVWIDTNTRLPIDPLVVSQLANFKTCLVSPDRWGRPLDISRYAAQMKSVGFMPDAVMTELAHAEEWTTLLKQQP